MARRGRHWLHPRVSGATHQDRVAWRRRMERLNNGGSVPLIQGNSSVYLSSAALGGQPATFDALTISAWVQIVDLGPSTGDREVINTGTPSENRLRIFQSSETMTSRLENSAGGQVHNATLLDLSDGQPHHVMHSGRFTPSDEARVWVDGVNVSTDLAFAGTAFGNLLWNIGADQLGARLSGTDTAFGAVWVDNAYVADPTGVFIDSDGKPMVGGVDGSGFTGTSPMVYFNELADFNSGANQGRLGGTFTKNGTGNFTLLTDYTG